MEQLGTRGIEARDPRRVAEGGDPYEGAFCGGSKPPPYDFRRDYFRVADCHNQSVDWFRNDVEISMDMCRGAH